MSDHLNIQSSNNLIIDEKINQYHESLFHHMFIKDDLKQNGEIQNVLVCIIKHAIDSDNANIFWKLDLNIMNEIKFINNLDLIISNNTITTPIAYVFAAIECIRLYFKKDSCRLEHIKFDGVDAFEVYL
jgi:hypothetical protein